MVSDSELVTRLRQILRSSDLETTTPASVRRQLEAYFGVELTDKKAFVREQIDAFLESDAVVESKPQDKEDEEDSNGDENDEEGSENDADKTERPVEVKKRRGGFNKISQLSQLARTEVVKKLWEYIHKHDLQDPKNRQNIICDESLHSLFRVKTINMFQMNKALSKHIWPLIGDGCVINNVKAENEDETSGERFKKKDQTEEAGENNEEESHEEVDRSVGRKRKKRIQSNSEEKPKKKGGGFTKVCSLSPQLQAFTGTPQLARTESEQLTI